MANNKKEKAKGRRKRSNKCLVLKNVKELSSAPLGCNSKSNPSYSPVTFKS
ncbi:hypothetical protein ACE6H2_015467 [Prunus campanulata]